MPATASSSPSHDSLADEDDDTTTAQAGPPAAAERADDELSELTLRPVLTAGPTTVPSSVSSPAAPSTDVTADDLAEVEEPEPEEDSITTLAPRLSPSAPKIAAPRSVEIRTVAYDDDDADETETEVRTTPGIPIPQITPTMKPVSSAGSTSPRPAAGVPPSEAARSKLPDLEDAQLSDSEDRATPARPVVPVDDDDITTKGTIPTSATGSTYEEDSVTTRALPMTTAQMDAAIAELGQSRQRDPLTLEGSTKRIPKRAPAAGQPPPAGKGAAPADAEPESITTQAHAPLTNMLRVIAADGTPDDGTESANDDEEEHGSDTEVMPNAPLKRAADVVMPDTSRGLPAIRPTRPLALAAAQLAPASESGLRTSRPPSGVALAAAHDPRAFAATEAFQATAPLGQLFTPPPMNIATLPPGTAPMPPSAPSMQPSAADAPPTKGPRYGLLVGVVALVSVVVPGSLYVGLQEPGSANNGMPAAAASELEGHDGTPRGKLDKKAAASVSASASALASPSASSSHGRPPLNGGGRKH